MSSGECVPLFYRSFQGYVNLYLTVFRPVIVCHEQKLSLFQKFLQGDTVGFFPVSVPDAYCPHSCVFQCFYKFFITVYRHTIFSGKQFCRKVAFHGIQQDRFRIGHDQLTALFHKFFQKPAGTAQHSTDFRQNHCPVLHFPQDQSALFYRSVPSQQNLIPQIGIQMMIAKLFQQRIIFPSVFVDLLQIPFLAAHRIAIGTGPHHAPCRSRRMQQQILLAGRTFFQHGTQPPEIILHHMIFTPPGDIVAEARRTVSLPAARQGI